VNRTPTSFCGCSERFEAFGSLKSAFSAAKEGKGRSSRLEMNDSWKREVSNYELAKYKRAKKGDDDEWVVEDEEEEEEDEQVKNYTPPTAAEIEIICIAFDVLYSKNQVISATTTLSLSSLTLQTSGWGGQTARCSNRPIFLQKVEGKVARHRLGLNPAIVVWLWLNVTYTLILLIGVCLMWDPPPSPLLINTHTFPHPSIACCFDVWACRGQRLAGQRHVLSFLSPFPPLFPLP